METVTSHIISDITNRAEYIINDAWWDGFLEKTQHFTNTTVINQAFSDNEAAEMTDMVTKVIREICRLRTSNYGFRVYVSGERLNGEEVEKVVFNQPPSHTEHMEDWVKRTFPDNKFGMIINGGEKFSAELAQRLAIYAAPLIKKAGIPLNGLHSTIFIGNYGLTPLGIHQDHVGGNVIHFHLGPGGKIMYTWEESHFKELLHGRNKKEVPVEELLPYANQFPFGKGDIYFMPWNQFHIGYSDEFSIGVTLWFDNHIRKSVLSSILDSFRRQYLNTEDTVITSPEQNLKDLKGYADIDAVLQAPDYLKKKTFSEFLQEVYEEYMFSLFSNEGWSMRPLSLAEECNYDENDFEQLAGKSVRIVHPFKILYRHIREINKIMLFVRGSKIELNYHPEIAGLVNKLNEEKEIVVTTLIEQVAKQLPAEAVLYILSLLNNRRGIEVVA